MSTPEQDFAQTPSGPQAAPPQKRRKTFLVYALAAVAAYITSRLFLHH
ncbi:hypothetical protein SAMN02745857_00934 [Andreprevotia lacus DSM 23236]|jgi:hypothetical protein|uniref:Uncharacterized protein n=1 Tax=Andreprevotia lacus DSM 23236 TaxID=1121001 RepID=A0A1W1XA28_9NEIS|nr:hypothetical protein [Andreprevotia lacus]SMC20391.1 hypothetical protein SAMN02745857_00934 [Andreprevotia lacus DSM 23236]